MCANYATWPNASGVTVRQLGWDAERLQSILLRARSAQPPRAEAAAEVVDRSKWDMAERGRIAEALDRKVLWEKMRKYRMFDDEPEAREFE